ncbi:MAG: molybdate ABC transporter substrate-binding protein [Chloroflexi bacterium]|nr:molybdate ABC transporter substrate-binding protein [Chloroflexota bacterium]
MTRRGLALISLGLLWLALGCAGGSREGRELTVSAASDVAPAFQEIGKLFQEQSGVVVSFNFGSTGQLAQQIAQGAPVDVFAAADASYVEELERQGLVLPGTKATYAVGHLVLWVRKDSLLEVGSLGDLAKPEVKRVAIANPEHAPYGVAAREALRAAGLWDALGPKLVLAESVRQALQYAETGNVDAAAVSHSLVVHGDGRWVPAPQEMYTPLSQTLAVLNATKHPEEARAFAAFVLGQKGRETLARYGFTFPGKEEGTN